MLIMSKKTTVPFGKLRLPLSRKLEVLKSVLLVMFSVRLKSVAFVLVLLLELPICEPLGKVVLVELKVVCVELSLVFELTFSLTTLTFVPLAKAVVVFTKMSENEVPLGS